MLFLTLGLCSTLSEFQVIHLQEMGKISETVLIFKGSICSNYGLVRIYILIMSNVYDCSFSFYLIK